jgi:peptidoglycan/LPS O-acetylase OafA/YrhL
MIAVGQLGVSKSASNVTRQVLPTERNTDSRTEHLGILDALRGLAALSVAIFHFTHQSSGFLQRVGSYGWLGVEAFFVISGFVIPLSLYRAKYRLRKHWRTYLAKRITRLDPPYLVSIAVVIALAYASALSGQFRGPKPHVSVSQLLLHFGYLNTFAGRPWLNPVYWTLAIEFQYYLLLAVLYPVLTRTSWWIRVSTLTALCAAAVAIPNPSFVFHYMGLFALGIATFYLHTRVISRPLYLTSVVLLEILIYLTMGLPEATVGLIAALIIAFVRFKPWQPLAFLGTVSYSLYLLHIPIGSRVVHLGERLPSFPGASLVVTVAALGASLISAYIFYRLIERPAQSWSRRLRYSEQEPAPAQAAHFAVA